ncbi:UDP-N-acetylmuramoyl-L-alanine--D-glutamate ligase [Candidatus Saccharibacteria bacterium]|nr:UDP-N-acetylmuramoyl-L-alanine--D-glutamate ligase [Candidatus Saccharibacteria bacterium]
MTLDETQRHAVVGYGVEGKSTAKYLQQHCINPIILDKKSIEAPALKCQTGDDWLKEIDSFDVMWRSPSVDPDLLPTDKTTSQTQYFLENCTVPVIGVTATKGKGTICSLITALLRADGYQVWLVGNIGQPALDVLDEINNSDATKKMVVYEMSSFQLWGVTKSPHIAVIGMVSQDHLDIHHSIDDYHQAKARITKFQSQDDRLIFNGKNGISKQLAKGSSVGHVESYNQPETSHYSEEAVYFGSKTIIDRDKLQLLGDHNAENICAALSVIWQLVSDKDIIEKTLANFKPLEHRMEVLPRGNGIFFINDSYSSNPSATLAAANSVKTPIILLLGGVDRAQDYEVVARSLSEAKKLRAVVVYGENFKKWQNSLNQAGVKVVSVKSNSFHEAFNLAQENADSGDTILLSPGSPSTDMFTNFTERGNEFKRLVAEL